MIFFYSRGRQFKDRGPIHTEFCGSPLSNIPGKGEWYGRHGHLTTKAKIILTVIPVEHSNDICTLEAFTTDTLNCMRSLGCTRKMSLVGVYISILGERIG